MKASNSSVVFSRGTPRLDFPALRRFVASVSRAARLRGPVSVWLTRNAQIRRLNIRFRGQRSATDVLSFPALRSSRALGGDIAVSLDMAERNARRLGHSVSDEIRILILHGLLHLAGYDHESDGGEMEKKEASLRRRFSLPGALIERSSRPPTYGKGAKARATVERSKL
jgi:probable rRNA maturation factor